MAEWASGYVTEVNYTLGYYRELSPLAMRFALLCAGYEAPPAENFSYCELGFGQGVSLNFHAAAHAGSEFFGADINPAHVAGAQAMADASGAALNLTDDGFADLLARPELPRFDYIGVHGVWSWISAENQANMVEFIRRTLKPGGALYLSFNCLPGWSGSMPLRHLLTEHAGRSASGNVINRLEGALDFTQKLIDTGLGYFGQAGVKDKFAAISKQNRNYLAHEYMNRDWRIMHFAEVAEALAGARLEFAASAALVDQLDGYRIAKPGLELLATVKDPVQYQTVRDYLINQQFRRDIFVRGPRRLTSAEQRRRMDACHFVALRPAAELRKMAAEGNRRGLPGELFDKLVDGLDGRIAGWPELAAANPEASAGLMRQALMLLIHFGDIAVTLAPAARAAAAAPVGALNAWLTARAGEGNECPYLCSPVIGGAVTLSAFQQMMVRVLARGVERQPEAMAQAAWADLSAVGQRVISAGKTCETEADNLATLNRIAKAFLEEDLPLLTLLGLVPEGA